MLVPVFELQQNARALGDLRQRHRIIRGHGEFQELRSETHGVRTFPEVGVDVEPSVEDEYDPGRGERAVRRVEPYRLLLRSGTAYLVGYDLERRGWRTFALDRFSSLPERAETIQNMRVVPEQYDSTDTIGFFKTAGHVVAVTVELTATVAASATSRRWQTAQRVEQRADGSAQITFEVTDIVEVVRWSLGFGKDAKIVAPPEAVEVALRTVAEITQAYGR